MKGHLVLVALLATSCAPPLRHTTERPAERQPPLPPPPIDELLAQSWSAAGITPAPDAQDGEFLRRVTLDLLGRVPTLPETKSFLAWTAPDKRAQVVDRLLASREFAEHWGDLYGDLLFGQEGRAAKLERRYDPAAWLVQAFDENLGYDRMAAALLTARGDVRENGAVAFVGAHLGGGGGPEAVAGAAARIFLGLQIQCAQCHDHPYDPRWKQGDFYGLVAFFARTKSKNEKVEQAAMMSPAAMPRPGKAKPDKTLVLFDAPRGEAKMHRPHSEEEVTVAPRFLGAELTQRPFESRRVTVARAIIASDLFAKAMVSRTWAQLFGHGIVDPWDDLGGENDPRHPPLLSALARDFAASRYNIKHLLRTIVLSRAYGRSAAGGAGGQGDAIVRAFARTGVRPLEPEALFRSLVVATGAESIARARKGAEELEGCAERPGPARRGPRRAQDSACPIDKKLGQAFREFQFTFGDDEMAEADRFDGSVPQALLLFNGELTNTAARAAPGGVLDGILTARSDPEGRLQNMFLAVYSRLPTSDERQRLGGYLRDQGNGRPAYEDVFFTLLTSTEAITNH
jgi:uncharacterized protein DUF1549/uncharacterized protein DUF1553